MRLAVSRISPLAFALCVSACGAPVAPEPVDGGSDGAAIADAGAIAPDCTGTFGTGAVVAPGVTAATSPAVTADELELFLGDGMSFAVVSRSALDRPFTSRRALLELDAACPSSVGANRQIDVSADGLRVYFACGDGPGQLFSAHRSDRTSAFVVDGPIADGVQLPAISSDELAVLDGYGGAPFRATRAAIGDSFPTLHIVAELAMAHVVAPSLSPDGLTLYAASAHTIVSYDRSSTSATFGTAATTLDVAPAGEELGSPEISPSCRTLYFLGHDAMGTRVFAASR